MYQRDNPWEKYLERYGFRDDLSGGLQRKNPPPVRLASFAVLVAPPTELDFIMQRNLVAPVTAIDTRTVSPEGLRASFDWAMGSVLWRLELTRPALQETAGLSAAESVAAMIRRKADQAYQAGAYSEALAGLEACAVEESDFALHLSLGHLYLYHRHPAALEKASLAYLHAVEEAAPRAPLYAGRALLWAAFVDYLLHNDQAGLELLQHALTLAPQMSEAWYLLARFAALLGQPAQALPALEQAFRADRNYALRAAADADLLALNGEITSLLERLRLEARQKTDAQGRSMLAEIKRLAIPTSELPNSQRLQDDIAERWKQDTLFGYLDASAKMMHFKVYMDGLRLDERDQVASETTEMLSRLTESIRQVSLPASLQDKLHNQTQESQELLANLPTLEQAQAAREKTRQAQALWQRAASQTVLTGHTGEINLLAFQPNGSLLVSSGSNDKSLLLWDTISGETRAILNGHNDIINALVFSPDGQWLASGGGVYKGADFTVRIWDVTAGRSRSVIDWHTNQVNALTFSPDSTRLASAGGDWRVGVWSAPEGVKLDMLEGHQGAVTCLAFSPDSKLLASGGEEGAIRLWNLEKGEQVGILLGHQAAVQAVLITSDGSTLISAGEDQTLREWDFALHHLRAVHEQPAKITALALSPDGKRLAWALGEDGLVRLWSLRESSTPLELPGHTGKINSLAFSADSQLLASAGEDGLVRLWDAASGQGKAIRSGHDQPVECLSFALDGCLLASGGKDKTVRLWGLVLSAADAAAITNEAEQRAAAIERERKEREAAAERQRLHWRSENRCEVCGTKLSLVDRLGKQVRCKEHRL
jgi:WD40 repeat protein/tetratricopeptide (TPR) repeat protein